jgi:hypothetical protein
MDMENQKEVYEAPMLSEAGDFKEVTSACSSAARSTAVTRRSSSASASERRVVSPVARGICVHVPTEWVVGG